MIDKKEAAPGAGTPKSGGGKGCLQASDNPHSNFTTGPRAGQAGIISGLLLHGQKNAIPLRQLKVMTGIPGREIRKMIERERRGGTPILSDNIRGYFLPENEGETARFVKSMKHRANEILKSVAAIEQGGDK